MKSLVVILTLSFFALFISSCERVTDVSFVNETPEKLEFYTQSDTDGALLGTVYADARSSVRYGMIARDYVWLRVAATREDGEWVFDHMYTRDELEKAKRTTVVSSLDRIAPPADVIVMPPTDDSARPVAPPITFVNETQGRVVFYTKLDTQGALTGTVSLGAASSWETPNPRFDYGTITAGFAWLRVAATRDDGEWVFDHLYLWRELQQANRRIVVSSLEPMAPPVDVTVIPYQGAPPPVLPPTPTTVATGEAPAAAREPTQTQP